MAELAAGAVSSLLGIIRNEAQLLGRVGGDVQFIKEEMESINSFLEHLTRTAPPYGGEHNEQIRTWMKQVRVLAHDCSTCIDLYLQRSDPAIHSAKGGIVWRYVCWAPWFVKKLVAQHKAATELRELKARVEDLSARRMRYGVVVTAASSPGPGHGSQTAPHSESETVAVVDGRPPNRRRALEPRTLEDYCCENLHKWLKEFNTNKGSMVPFISVEAPHREDAATVSSIVSYVAVGFNPELVWVNLPVLHAEFDLPLKPWEILCYILGELKPISQPEPEPAQGSSRDQRKEEESKDDKAMGCDDDDNLQSQASDKKWQVFEEMWEKIEETNNVDDRIKELETKINNIKNTTDEIQKTLRSQEKVDLNALVYTKPLGILFLALLPPMRNDVQCTRRAMRTLASGEANIIRKIAEMLKIHMEASGVNKIDLSKMQYVNILREVFPTASSTPLQQAQEQDKSTSTKSTALGPSATATMLGEDQIKEIVHKAMQDKQLEKPLEAADAIEETKNKIGDIREKIKVQLVIEGIVDKIKGLLNKDKRTLIILQDDKGFLSSCEEITMDALSLLGYTCADAMVVVITKESQVANKFCYPPRDPITYSIVGLYHDTVLQLTSQQAKQNNNYNSQILRDILNKCDPDEFCMKMFAHALYANPNRSNNDLRKLYKTLVPQKSLVSNATKASPDTSNDNTQLVSQQSLLCNNAKKIFEFSYNDMPTEYMSCLLYLAIFPRGQSIRRSTLQARWIVEGLITGQDWPSAVRNAERCFDVLIDRWLVYPGDVTAAGKVKSCMVDNLVHEFITKAAMKKQIVEESLSHRLAHHFSIFSNLRLRRSDTIEKFMQNLKYFSPYLRLLKVLDLEGCQLFDKNNHYLEDICNKILLLKYLSLRGTNVAHLPNAINNLQELEVLDIRQTKVPEIDTKFIMLFKLKRLLAGQAYSSPRSISTGMYRHEEIISSSVRIPRKIEKMVKMEVMHSVNVSRDGNVLTEIGKLRQIRKLGVVIDDHDGHLRKLLQVISDLSGSLRSLSITLIGTGSEQTLSSEEISADCLKQHSNLLESLSISGVTDKVQLLPLLAKGQGNRNLAKVTIGRTKLKQEDLKDIANLHNLCCFRLRHRSYDDEKITFEEKEFLELKYLIIEGTNMMSIIFKQGAAPKIEKIILSFTSTTHIDGIVHLPNLKELELKGNNNDRKLRVECLAGAPHLSKLTLDGTLLDLNELKILAELPSLRSLILLQQSCVRSSLNFNNGEFRKLNLLVVNCSDITSISFTDEGAAPKLEKITWSFTTTMVSLSGICYLPQLKELELNGDIIPDQVIQDINEHKNKLIFNHQ
uniref:Uncharacterized protein n=1 Tax=Oryza punctata TaxID=4537 RepID=A0A0E0MHR5_ORYPU